MSNKAQEGYIFVPLRIIFVFPWRIHASHDVLQPSPHPSNGKESWGPRAVSAWPHCDENNQFSCYKILGITQNTKVFSLNQHCTSTRPLVTSGSSLHPWVPFQWVLDEPVEHPNAFDVWKPVPTERKGRTYLFCSYFSECRIKLLSRTIMGAWLFAYLIRQNRRDLVDLSSYTRSWYLVLYT